MEITYLPAGDLIEAEYNPRTISQKEYDDILSSLKRFGFVDPIVINTHPESRISLLVAVRENK